MTSNSSVKSLKLRLDMQSDWHVGTGAGVPGSIDALLARDADGFPYVPAKTVVGIWRDAMETLTLGLDSGNATNKVWQKWVDVIFGSQPSIDRIPTDTPRSSIVSIEPARLDQNLRDAIGNDERLKQALTFLKPNTAIHSESGTAKTESLRITEMGRIGTVLEAGFKLDFDILEAVSSEQKELIAALLVGSAALIERIGGKRRRGSGKCKMEAEGLMSTVDAVDVIKKSHTVETIPSYKQQVHSADAPQPAKGSEWRKIKYSLTLRTPVAIVTNTLGNVSETLDFIPGTYLLPHITKQLTGISKYVAAGDFQVSPATIDAHGKRGLPVPRVIYYHKVDGGFHKTKTVYNRLQENIEGGEQKKNYREGYISSLDENGTLPFYEKTKNILLMHNTVEDSVQRPTETVGGVFSRQAIRGGTTLRGEIRFKKSIEGQVKALESYTNVVRLGTSKKDDYGLAELTLEQIENETSSVSDKDELVVYLESDVLLRNGNLRQTNLVEELEAELEKTLGGVTLMSIDDRIKKAREQLEKNPNDKASKEVIEETKGKESLIQVRRIESWHEGWGFPRPTLTAMASGSVVVFDVAGKIDPTKLQNLELSGIGERRGEGYGRIRFNPPLLMNTINSWTPSKKTTTSPTTDDKEAIEKLKAKVKQAKQLEKFIRIIELAAWRDELARAVLKLADDEEQRKRIFGFESKGNVPPMSQVGGLRSAIMRLMQPKDELVLGFLKHLKDTDNRVEKWDVKKNKEKAKKKLEQIEDLINDKNKVWLILCDTKVNNLNVWSTPRTLLQTEDQMRSGLWADAVKSLFDACARAHKRDMEREEQKGGRTNG